MTMEKYHNATAFRKILVPIVPEDGDGPALTFARAVSRESRIVLVGAVGIPDGQSLSTAPPQARKVRSLLHHFSKDRQFRIRERVRVAHRLWGELIAVLHEEQPDLLVLEWPRHFEALKTTPAEVLGGLPCDLAIVRAPIPERPQKLLVSLRGSVYAEQALRLSLAVAHTCQAQVTALHVAPPEGTEREEAPFRGLARVLMQLPEVEQVALRAEDPGVSILQKAREFDLVVVGMAARPDQDSLFGPVTARIVRESPTGVVVVRTKRQAPADLESELVGHAAISILVDKWFAENTYYADEFAGLDYLLDLKRRQNLTVSLALPALNEAETIGNVIRTVKSALIESVPLLDEIVLIDSNSTDGTRAIAASLDVPVYIHQEILPQYKPRHGKGEALWKSLYVTRGDIILWIDTDIVNIHPRFVYGLLGPLLLRQSAQFVKGFYRRPLRVGDKVQAGGGGRVTELTARPLLNLFYPELSGVVQPLSGEYGGRRAALEQLPFSSGYGVEIGLLIDVLEKFGLSAITQVDLQERIHHNQPLEALSKMSFAIIQSVARKLERRHGWRILEEVNRSMKLIRYEPGRFFLEVEEIAERERPPMIELPEYRQRFAR